MDAPLNVYKSKRYSDEAKWICIYPLYLNSRKTIAHGRRIAKEKAVDSPTCQEMFDVLTSGGFKVKLEKHVMHPLDPNRDTNSQGRVRVQLNNDDGTPCNAAFPKRMSLMLYLCDMIPKLKNRQVSGGAGAQTVSMPKSNKKNKKR